MASSTYGVTSPPVIPAASARASAPAMARSMTAFATAADAGGGTTNSTAVRPMAPTTPAASAGESTRKGSSRPLLVLQNAGSSSHP